MVITDYYWPDQDNTARAFIYEEGGTIVVNPGLSAEQQARAKRMIDLVGLDKNPGNDPAASDRRWTNRLEAWGMAKRARQHVQKFPVPEMRDQVVDTALAKGFRSIWMTVFQDDPIMRVSFINSFKGTSATSFGPGANPIHRPNGDL